MEAADYFVGLYGSVSSLTTHTADDIKSWCTIWLAHWLDKTNYSCAVGCAGDALPNCYQIAKKWNISDHDKRVRDGSLIYDYFNVSDGKIEYCISKCMYVEMFKAFGIRSLCKISCMTDTTSYENLPKHVRFIRHSDLSDGDRCHDEVIDKGK